MSDELPPLPADRVWVDRERIAPYANDEAARGSVPRAVCFPESAAEVAEVLRWANRRRVPIIPRGAGSGLSGAAIASPDGVVLSLERLNKHLVVNAADLNVEADPGVITGDIRRAAEAQNLLYAPIPASVDFCTIGGNVATNAGGLCAVKYGVTREHVLGLECVLPTGEIMRTGGAFTKSTAGYNLTQLICGSEGTLAVVTRVILKLLPLPTARMTMLAPFDSLGALVDGVLAVLAGPVTPPTMELLPRAAVRCVLERHPDYSYPFRDATASLLLEVDGRDPDVVASQLAAIAETLEKAGSGEARVAATPAQREELWTLRKQVRDSIANRGEYVEADCVVPRRHLAKLLEAAEAAANISGLEQISYGHAGDGNLHTYFLRPKDQDDVAWHDAGHHAMEFLIRTTASLGGTLSGEHGVGTLKRNFLPLVIDAAQLALMRRVKQAFDPNNILNPGKIFD